MGYVITVYFTEIVNATLSITKLLCVAKVRVRIFDWIVKPLFSIVISTSAVSYMLRLAGAFASSKAEIALHVFFIALVYFSLLIFTRALSLKKMKRSIMGFIKA
jgi:hypothetical protein